MRALVAAAWAVSVGLTTTLGITPARAAGPEGATASDDRLSLPATALEAPPIPAELLTEHHGWLTIAYPPALYDSAQRLVHDADAARGALTATIGVDVLQSIEVRLARTPQEMALLSPREAPPPHARGVAYAPLRLIVLLRSSTDDAATVEETFRHELTHVALFDATAGRPMPRWLDEGFAVHATGERAFERLTALWMAQVRGSLQSLGQLEGKPGDASTARTADAEQADLVRFLAERDDGARFVAFLARVRSGEAIESAAAGAFGADLRSLEQQWRADVVWRCVTVPLCVGGAVGWGVAALAILRARRRKRRRDALGAADVDAPAEATVRGEKLVVVEEGAGHVVLIERPRVPTVEHDGKMHTLH